MEKFFTEQVKRSQPSPSPQSGSSTERDKGDAPAPREAIPKGVVLGKDGKPYVVHLGGGGGVNIEPGGAGNVFVSFQPRPSVKKTYLLTYIENLDVVLALRLPNGPR